MLNKKINTVYVCTYVLVHRYIPAIVIKTAFLTGVSPNPIRQLIYIFTYVLKTITFNKILHTLIPICMHVCTYIRM